MAVKKKAQQKLSQFSNIWNCNERRHWIFKVAKYNNKWDCAAQLTFMDLCKCLSTTQYWIAVSFELVSGIDDDRQRWKKFSENIYIIMAIVSCSDLRRLFIIRYKILLKPLAWSKPVVVLCSLQSLSPFASYFSGFLVFISCTDFERRTKTKQKW